MEAGGGGGRVAGARALVEGLCGAFADEHATQVRQVELIDALCAAYSSLDDAGPTLPGRERLVRAGAEGTPWVAEHLATELAPKLRMTVMGAGLLIADAMDLVHRHPVLWGAVRAGRLPVWQARQVARTTSSAGLGVAAAAWVDQRLEPALGRLPWGRLRAKLAGLIVRADTELAARRAARARAQRFVRVQQEGDGTAFIFARADAVDALRFSRQLDQVAGQLALAGDTDEHEVLRAKALGVLADPGQAVALLAGPDAPATDAPADGAAGRRRGRGRASAELVIHLAPGSGVGRCEELGPVLEDQVKAWLGHDRVVVRPVVDLADNPAVDAYEVPEGIARVVRWRSAFEAFPWSTRRSQGLDLDHTVPFRHGPDGPVGQTCPDNLGPLTRRVHRAKTHAGWELEQVGPGAFEWTSRLGFRYHTDQSGSYELPPAGRRQDEPVPPEGGDGRGRRPAINFPLQVDLWWTPPRPRAA